MHGEVLLCSHEAGSKLVYVRSTKKLYVLAYVDDLMFFGSKPDIDLCVQDLQKDLLLKMTGTLTEGQTVTFLGREIRRTAHACELYMKPEYIDSMLQLYSMSACKPAAAPGTDTLQKAQEAQPLSAEDHKRYRRVVGQLVWLCNVRPDIMFAVKELSRGLSAPTSEHECKVKQLLLFLAGTKLFTQQLRPILTLSPQHKGLDIQVFVDSDWAGCPETRRSTSGVSLFVLGASILSHSRTQATVAVSSREAELHAIGSGIADALFVRSVVEEPSFSRKRTSLSALTAMLARASFRALEHLAKRSMCTFGFFTCKNSSCPAWFACVRSWVL